MVMAETLSRRSPIKVGFYDIVKTIGRGNFAEVKLAKHRITKTEVAIKIIDKRRLDQLNLKKIYREIQILKLLNHQHIIKLYQVMETSSTIYLVCEYARNGELFDFITEQGRLPEDKAKKMFWQVLTAVEYCHKNNVVHRDLKAENLLLDSNNNIKLADFGFSNFYQSGNMLSTWCGSPPYAAPEVFEGKLYEGPHLDIWSLGIVLYVLVCGTFPFDGSNLATLKERVLAGRFRIPFWMSQDCENLVRRMLVLNPKKRLTIAQIKKHKWMQSHIVNSNAVLSHTKSSSQLPRRGKLSEYNENVLKIMQGLGIDQQKTLDSLNTSAYDHLFAIYQLLVDRLKTHRTSYPHDVTASCNSGRRPSNVADQAVASISHKHRRGAYPDFTTTANTVGQSMRESTLPEMRFDDMTTGLPVIQRSFVNPLRYTSPPLPQIKTSLYEEDQTQENETMLSCHSSLSPSNHVSENGILAFNYQISNLQLPASIHQDKNEIEEIEMEGYNLQKRRHSLMVPNPSSLLFPSGTTRRAAQCSPINSAMKLNKSGDDVYFKQCASGSGYTHHPESSVNKQPELSYAKKSNVLLPSGIPAQSDNRSAYQPNRRRSGVSPLVRNCSPNSNSPGQEHEISEANTMYSTERHHLNASPIGFREGRRASDGLLLLANSSLKEHLQKLSRTKAVPEMAQEDSHESWESNDASSVTNQLQVPNSMNRCRSGDRVYTNHSMGTPSHSASPSGSGSSFCFQPYNNLSIAKRKSLQVPILQISGISSQNQSDEQQFNDLCSKDQLPENFQNLVSHIVPDPASANLIETSETSFHWSSWKPVVKSSFTDGEEVKLPPGKWQQFNSSINGNRQDEPSLIGKVAFSVASDEALPSKAAAAQQQQQRDSMTKPIRQQSLPINSTSNAYSFGVAPTHNQSLAQLLQQRRLQRRLKVATHNQHIPGYNLPLSELEQLKIDNSDALNHFKTYQLQNTLTTFPFPPNLDLNDSNQLNQTQQLLHYATAVYTNEFTDNNPYKNESVLPVSGDYPVQEMLSFHNNQTFYENNELMSQSSYRLSPSHAMFPTSSPNAADTDNPWSYDSKVMYRNCNVMPFNKLKFYDVEGLTSSTEKLDQTMNENMEFALY